jgi:hypothetical protein
LKSQFIVCMLLILAMLAYPALGAGGCGKWVIRDNTDFLIDPMFDDAVASSTGNSATVNPDSTPKEAKNKTQEMKEKAAVSEKKAPSIDLAGKWRVMLEKNPAEQNIIDLILIQTGDRLQGYGTLLEEGSDSPATATGSISEEGISLDVKLIQQKKDYRLDMALVKSELEGSYELYDMEALAENGNATARRSSS